MLTKPPAALGRLEDLAIWYAGWRGQARPRLERPQCLVFAGNHGIAAKGVSAFPAEVTVQMVANFRAGGAAINQLCDAFGAQMEVIELDLDTPTGVFSETAALSEADLLVNVAALKDHSMAGVTLSLKNNFGLISGAELLHGNIKQGSGCEPGISELAARPEIRDKLRIAAIDALVGVCQGGPGPTEARYAFRYGGLLLSRDPVALDRRGQQIIEARRKTIGLCPLGQRTSPNPSPPSHIDAAAARGVSPG
mgnify:CR=1 FL=1